MKQLCYRWESWFSTARCLIDGDIVDDQQSDISINAASESRVLTIQGSNDALDGLRTFGGNTFGLTVLVFILCGSLSYVPIASSEIILNWEAKAVASQSLMPISD